MFLAAQTLRVVFRPVDDLILDRLADLAPVLRKASHADHQVTIIVGLLLGLAQNLGRGDIELDMEAALAHVGTDDLQQLLGAVESLDGRRMDLDIHLRVLAHCVVIAGSGFKHSINTVLIRGGRRGHGAVGVGGAGRRPSALPG